MTVAAAITVLLLCTWMDANGTPWSRRPCTRPVAVSDTGVAHSTARLKYLNEDLRSDWHECCRAASSAPAAVHPRTGSEKRMQHVLALN